MDKGVDRFAHFAVRKKERRGEGLSGSPKRLFSPRFIFDSVARRPSRLLTAFRKYVAPSRSSFC